MPELTKLTGSDVLYRAWPAEDPKAALLLVHGLGAHAARWDFFGQYCRRQGFSCYAIELKGFGQTSNRPRGHIDSFQTYYDDILTLRQQLNQELPGNKVFIIGESLGGLIAYITAAIQPGGFSGQVLMSPGFANAMKFSLLDYLQLPFFLLFDRQHLFKMPFTSAMCTRDEAYQKLMENNPDEWRFASARLLLLTLLAQLNAKSLAPTIRFPTLFQLSGKDQLVSPAAAKKVFQKIGSTDKTLIDYPEMFHALYIDLGREKVFADMLNWLERRV